MCVFYICFDRTFIELISSALNIYKLLLGLCENVSQQLLTLVAQKLQHSTLFYLWSEGDFLM